MSDKRSRIMIVEDENINLAVLSQILSPEYDLETAINGQDVLQRCEDNWPDLILLDIILPDMNGFDVLRKLKASDSAKDIPVIIINGRDNQDDEEMAFLLGAADYITKPFNNTIVLTRVATHLQIARQARAIEELNLIDPLTGLPNRRSFDKRLMFEWKRAVREKKALSLLLIEIDNFKSYNEAYGNVQGVELLKAAADVLLKNARRPADFSARLGDEMFGVLLPDTVWESALFIAENVRKTIKDTILPTVDGKSQTSVSVSIGLATKIPQLHDKPAELVNLADECLHQAKQAGCDRIIGKVL